MIGCNFCKYVFASWKILILNLGRALERSDKKRDKEVGVRFGDVYFRPK